MGAIGVGVVRYYNVHDCISCLRLHSINWNPSSEQCCSWPPRENDESSACQKIVFSFTFSIITGSEITHIDSCHGHGDLRENFLLFSLN